MAGGGMAGGGLGGANTADGSIEDAGLEDALGSAVSDDAGDNAEGGPPYAGHSGGAVGGSPAEKRAKGGHAHR